MKHTDSNPNYITLGLLQECLEPSTLVKFHFADYTKETYPNLIYTNKSSRVGSIYIGTDGVLHVTVRGDYEGDRFSADKKSRMKRYNYIGLNEDRTRCCLLRSLLDFSELEKYSDELINVDFAHDATDWGGSDEVDRTLEMRNYKLTGKEVRLEKPLEFKGCDSDCGHSYYWNFKVYTIAQVEEEE